MQERTFGMTNKRIAIVGIVGLPAKYGGFETLAHNLVKQLKEKYSFTIYCSAYAYKKKPLRWEGASLKYLPLKANGIQSIPYDMLSIMLASRNADIVLLLGVSGALIFPFLNKRKRRKIIVNIDGIEWRRSKWSKGAKRILKFLESLAVKYADVIVSDNEEIMKYVQKRYNIKSVLIEYGADHIISIDKSIKERYAFTVCRIEPENNIHLILEAFTCVGMQLKVVGNWHQSIYGEKLFKKYSSYENIELLSPIYDQQKLDLLRANCRLYIHGHSAGGTNPSLVEAMYLGLPVISFDVSYNIATTENKAIFFKNKEGLINILKNVSDEELDLVAKELKGIAIRRYQWKNISDKYSSIIEELI